VMDEEVSASDGEPIRVLTRAEFVEEVFYDSGYTVGAQIVGFNLPFDLSRLAIRHSSARRGMRGGFSLVLSEKEGRRAVAVKHLSQRTALIRFTGTRPEEKGAENDDIDPDAPHETEEVDEPDRGYFVDVKTVAAALTSQAHSLESLSVLLKVPTPKELSEEHGGPLTKEYIRYGLRDVQTTWECFDVLAQRFATFQLEDTSLYDLYSEASLGKAYLRTMNIKPWRQVQPDFPPKLVGHILSAYFGGRSEMHIRRQIVPVIHCDFLSMYPTVCTLMGLWEFVRANGITHSDDTQAIRELIAAPLETLVEHLRREDGWTPNRIGAGPAGPQSLPGPGAISRERDRNHRPQLSRCPRAAVVYARRCARVKDFDRRNAQCGWRYPLRGKGKAGRPQIRRGRGGDHRPGEAYP
jgi:hypothetical protein